MEGMTRRKQHSPEHLPARWVLSEEVCSHNISGRNESISKIVIGAKGSYFKYNHMMNKACVIFLAAASQFSTQSNLMAATYVVINVNDGGAGSFRQAILNANANAGTDRIEFNIPGGQPYTITPSSSFPPITGSVIIDATTQPGFAGTPIIELNGVNVGDNGLSVLGGNSTIQGLVINRFRGNGIFLLAAGGNVVRGNFLGTDRSGTVARGNTSFGLAVGTANNMVGGTNSASRNVISGNVGGGIGIYPADGTGNKIQGNFIGVTADGRSALANGGSGVDIYGSANNLIGGIPTATRNLISGNTQLGVIIENGSNGNKVQGNLIGLNVDGTGTLPNALSGVLIYGTRNNIIGGTTIGAGNVISGNGYSGVEIYSDAVKATGNLVQGNRIGTDPSGSIDLGNSQSGVLITSSANNAVGGTVAGAGNVISGNKLSGININGNGTTGNLVQGNLIGTDFKGAASLGNHQAGLLLFGSGVLDNTIGGALNATRNIISGNGLAGVELAGSLRNRIQGNYIGTDITGTNVLGNGSDGVLIDGGTDNTIGSTQSGTGNVISGNRLNGMELRNNALRNFIQGNFVGVGKDGVGALGNNAHGIYLQNSENNSIGGVLPSTRNVIAYNQKNGVFIESGVGNLIRFNSIFSNSDLGIDLGINGVTANDAGDADTGANNLQNFPVLLSARSSGGITGTLSSSPNTVYTIDFFANTAANSTGYGEGRTFLGSTTATTDASGNKSFAVTFTNSSLGGQWITATATDPGNNTSEFSAALEVIPEPRLTLGVSGPDLVFAWPTSDGANFIVEWTESLSPPITWTPAVEKSRTTSSGQWLVSIDTPATNRFFRLRNP